jgi:hypothetical protein
VLSVINFGVAAEKNLNECNNKETPESKNQFMELQLLLGKRFSLSPNCFSLSSLLSNTGRQARLAAEARHERTLAAVTCTPWLGWHGPTPHR